MRRILEVMFGHRQQLFLLLVTPVIVSLVVVYFLPRTYQATATLWALRRYEIVGATGPESDLLATPSSTQATALQELLQTHTFSLAVAHDSNLASTLDATTRANAYNRDQALFQDVSTHVVVTDQGSNLISIAYSNGNPQIAQQVVQAVITNYGLQSAGYSVAEGQKLLQAYDTQLTQAQQNADVATKAVAQYLKQHPEDLNPQVALADPQFQALNGQSQQAQTTLLNLQSAIATVNQELATIGTGSDGLFLVVDAPTVPLKAVSRLKTLALGGGVGLALALLSAAVYVLFLIRRDQSMYGEEDVHKATQLPLIMQLTEIPQRVVSLALGPGVRTKAGMNSSMNGTGAHRTP